MIIHKRFQKNYNEGSIEVQVNFNVDNSVVKVSDIQIKGSFNCGLPANPSIEEQNNNFFLVAHYVNIAEKNVNELIIGNKYADDIVKDILELKHNIIKDGK